MRLSSFQITNYRSIIDSDIVSLSDKENILVLAGQNESGKSSILKALRDFEEGEFEADSVPFSSENKIQTIKCNFKVEDKDDLASSIEDGFKEQYQLQATEGQSVLDKKILSKIKNFELTLKREADSTQRILDENTFNILSSAILDKNEQGVEGEANVQTKYVDIADKNSEVADIFWEIAPKIVFFDDFCDLLPDKILISQLKEEKKEEKGYRAVKNLEKILSLDLISKDSEGDAIRRTKEDKDNEALSINFQKDWGQRIHGENKVLVKYNFEKRNGEGESGSYVNFFVETKNGELLAPRQRSKGLIWFLSLWIELQAQDSENSDLILLLDEPDQHLHVKGQKDVLKLINKLSKSKQIFYATHSPYLIEVEHLNRIKLVLNTEKEGTKVEDILTSKIDSTYKKDALMPIAEAIGIGAGDFSKLNEKNVLLEGISDFYYFTAMKKILGANGSYNFIPGVGVRQINNLISLCIGYGLTWVTIIDDDPKVGGKDSKKKFDEIKDSLFDGDPEKTKEKIHVLDGIVGIENMFSLDDLKLVDSRIGSDTDKVKAVGKRRKVLFSRLFLEKVNKGEITAKKLSKTARDRFKMSFDFIETNLLK